MAGAPGPGNTQILDDGRREALQALVTSLSPEGSSSPRNLSGGDVDALTERLGHILRSGDAESGGGGGERRNEKGELVNEEGLPIIDISEPYVEPSREPRAPAARIAGRVPDFGPPVDSTPSDEKAKRRAEMDSIFDALEQEERADTERERRASEPVDPHVQAAFNTERKLAQRELQKKMGKALIRDFKEQREKEQQEEVKVYSQPPSAVPEGSNGSGQKTVKPKKSVSFNVPDDEGKKSSRQKPKPVMAWGDVSVNALKSGLPKPKLKSEEVLRQPMKMAVVERVPGQPSKLEYLQRDSDDESDPEVPQELMDEDDEGITPPLDGDEDDSYGSEHEAADSDEDEFDFSNAAQQREMALEYMRLRGSIGEEAYRAMTSHTHEGEDAWDQPEVPLEATLASKPYTPGVSRFRAERESRGFSSSSSAHSTSLGAAVLPGDKAVALQRAVRTGKLDEGTLVGPAEDSASEGDDAENIKRALEMLKNGVVVKQNPSQATTPSASTSQPPPQGEAVEGTKSTTATSMSTLTSTSSASSSSRPSRPPPIARSTPPPPSSSHQHQHPQSQTQSRHNQPTEGAFAFVSATPRIPPDPAVLSNLIVDSPSFPPPVSPPPAPRVQQPLVQEVRESASASAGGVGIGVRERSSGGGSGSGSGGNEGRKRPSRFLAERMGLDVDE